MSIDGAAVGVLTVVLADPAGYALVGCTVAPGFDFADFELARAWRGFSREMFETCFSAGYLVTDFVYEAGGDGPPRSFYVLTHGESSLSTL